MMKAVSVRGVSYESQYDVSKEQTGQLDEREQKSQMEIGGGAI